MDPSTIKNMDQALAILKDPEASQQMVQAATSFIESSRRSLEEELAKLRSQSSALALRDTTTQAQLADLMRQNQKLASEARDSASRSPAANHRFRPPQPWDLDPNAALQLAPEEFIDKFETYASLMGNLDLQSRVATLGIIHAFRGCLKGNAASWADSCMPTWVEEKWGWPAIQAAFIAQHSTLESIQANMARLDTIKVGSYSVAAWANFALRWQSIERSIEAYVNPIYKFQRLMAALPDEVQVEVHKTPPCVFAHKRDYTDDWFQDVWQWAQATYNAIKPTVKPASKPFPPRKPPATLGRYGSPPYGQPIHARAASLQAPHPVPAPEPVYAPPPRQLEPGHNEIVQAWHASLPDDHSLATARIQPARVNNQIIFDVKELLRRGRNKLCHACGQPDHKMNQCPHRSHAQAINSMDMAAALAVISDPPAEQQESWRASDEDQFASDPAAAHVAAHQDAWAALATQQEALMSIQQDPAAHAGLQDDSSSSSEY